MPWPFQAPRSRAGGFSWFHRAALRRPTPGLIRPSYAGLGAARASVLAAVLGAAALLAPRSGWAQTPGPQCYLNGGSSVAGCFPAAIRFKAFTYASPHDYPSVEAAWADIVRWRRDNGHPPCHTSLPCRGRITVDTLSWHGLAGDAGQCKTHSEGPGLAPAWDRGAFHPVYYARYTARVYAAGQVPSACGVAGQPPTPRQAYTVGAPEYVYAVPVCPVRHRLLLEFPTQYSGHYGYYCAPLQELAMRSSTARNSCEDGPRPGCATAGNPVDLAQGNRKADHRVDLVVAGDFPIVWERSYFPYATAESATGATWVFGRLKRADVVRRLDGTSTARVTRADGAQLVFEGQGAVGQRQWSIGWGGIVSSMRLPALRATLTDWIGQPGGVVLRNDAGEREFYTPAGRLAKVENAQGFVHTYLYDDAGRLRRIEQPQGRYLAVAYQGLPDPAVEATVVTEIFNPDPAATPVTQATPVAVWRNAGQRRDLFFEPVVASVTDGTRTVSYRWDVPAPTGSNTAPAFAPRLVAVQRAGGEWVYHYGEGGAMAELLTGVSAPDGRRMATYVYAYAGGNVAEEWKGAGPGAPDAAKIDRLSFGEGRITDALGQVYTFTKDGNLNRMGGYAQGCPMCSGTVGKAIVYDAAGRVQRRTDFNGVHTDYTYDGEGRAATATQAAGTALARTTVTTWVPGLGLPSTLTEPVLVAGVAGARVTTWSYNERWQPTQRRVVAPDGQGGSAARTWLYTYSPQGRLASVTDPQGRGVALVHNPHGDLIAQVVHPGTPAERVTRWGGHLADGLPRWTVDGDGLATTWVWDGNGRLRESRQGLPVGAVPTGLDLGAGAWVPTLPSTGTRDRVFTYSTADLLERVDEPDGTWTTVGYDAAGRATTWTVHGTNGAVTATVVVTLDAMSNPVGTTVLDATGQPTLRQGAVFDAQRRVKQTLNAAGQTLYTQAYDGEHQPTARTDRLDRATGQRFDALGRMDRAWDAAQSVHALSHGPQDEVLTASDARQVTTSYVYNGFGEVTRIVSPDRGTWVFGYDAAGRRTIVTDPRGAVATTSFDALSRPTSVTFDDAEVVGSPAGFQAGTVTHTFSYDACPHRAGRLCAVADGTGATAYAYNPWGEVVGKAWTGRAGTPGEGITLSVGYGYDAATGQLRTVTMPSGQTVQVGYGAEGRVVTLAYGAQPILSGARWTPWGAIAGWTWAQASGWSAPHSTVAFGHDLDGRPDRIRDVDDRALVWDPADRLVGVNDSGDASKNQLYGYDALDRLTSAEVGAWGAAQTYGYDPGGNRTSTIDQATGGGWRFGYALASNRQVSRTPVIAGVDGTPVASSLDTMGNLVDDGLGLQLAYDATGRMTRSTQGLAVVHAGYSALGQRVSKRVVGGPTAGTRLYAYDEEGRPLGVYVPDPTQPAGFRVEEEYVHLDGWRPVAVIKPDPITGMAQPRVFPVLTDHLGTPRKVLDGTTGEVRWAWDAKEPFGHQRPNETPTAGLPAFALDLRFPGQRADPETGLFHNGFRDYHPGLGRYVQSDPLGLEAGWNMYGYVGSNPLANTDSLGLVIDGAAFNNKDFRDSLAYLAQSPTARAIISAATKSKRIMYLNFNKSHRTEFIPSFVGSENPTSPYGTAHWDPTFGINIHENEYTNTCSRNDFVSPALNLLHEMIHFLQSEDYKTYEHLTNTSYTSDPSISQKWKNLAEMGAIKIEATVAIELGEYPRKTYNNKDNYMPASFLRPFLYPPDSTVRRKK